MTQRFEDVYGAAPQAVGEAPGRVNLLGEHTDYNDGYVLPIAIPQQTRVAIGLQPDPGAATEVYARSLDAHARFSASRPPQEQFARYIHGCLQVVREAELEVPALRIHVASDVPMGVGLSSSASLEVAVLRALRTLLSLPLDDVRVAQLAQKAEIEHAGVNCGVMDQMAASLAGTELALFLDVRTLERRLVALPPGTAILVIDSGIPRSLAASKYNERRAECEEAARRLGVPSLRDVTDPAATDALPDPLARRARHVITENNRVLRAIEGVDAGPFGMLMNESHASLRDDYEVSIPPLDALVDLLQRTPGVHGARLTGAGFGGACVALCDHTQVAGIAAAVLPAYQALGHAGRVLVPAAPTGVPV